MDDWPPFVQFDQEREPLLAEGMRAEETILLCVGVCAQSVLIIEKSSFDCLIV